MRTKEKSTKMKRKIPIFRLAPNKGITHEHISSHPKTRKAVLDELLRAIEEGIKKNKNGVELYEVYGADLMLFLEKKNWKSSLKHAMEYYIGEEDYSKCINIREMIKKLN